jgi:Na+-driven multidrug efflux pump
VPGTNILNVVVDRDAADNIKPTKATSPEKIDGIVASVWRWAVHPAQERGISLSLSAPAVYVIYNRVRSFVALPIGGIRNTIISVGAYNMGAGCKDRVRKLIRIAMTSSAVIMVIGTVLYETIPGLLLSIFSATDEMLAIGIPAFRIIGITLIISGMTIMMSGVFQSMNSSGKALIISVAQAASLVGSAALLSLTGSTSLVWFAFPVSEIIIFILSLVFLKGIYRKYLGDESRESSHKLK